MRKLYKYILFLCLMSVMMVTGEGVMKAYTFYATVETIVNQTGTGAGTGAGTAYVTSGETFTGGTSQSKTESQSFDEKGISNFTFKFSIQASPADGYHFLNWTTTTTDAIGSSITDENSTTTTVSVTSAKTNSPGAKVIATANFAQDRYYAQLDYTTEGSGSVTIDQSTNYTLTKGGDIVFKLTATPSSGYHFKEWKMTSGSGTFGNEITANTTYTVKASDTYDEENKLTYTIMAVFEADNYDAKLEAKISSISDDNGESSIAQIALKSDGRYASSIQYASHTANSAVEFLYKAKPGKGYKFVGWAESDNSDNSEDIFSTDTTGTCLVYSDSSPGGCNTKTIYAIFKARNTIEITASGTPESDEDRIVFKVAGDNGRSYRVSVPIGKTITLDDVPTGTYTITPKPLWSWHYSVVVNGSAQTNFQKDNYYKSSHTFDVTKNSRDSRNKHLETSATAYPK